MQKIKKWTTKLEYVDLQTGEVLTEKTVKEYYVIIKKKKNVKIHKELIWDVNKGRHTGEFKYRGEIVWTCECTREGKQGKLF